MRIGLLLSALSECGISSMGPMSLYLRFLGAAVAAGSGPVVLTHGSLVRSFTTLPAAISAAQPGDRITLYPGTYTASAVIAIDNLSIAGLGAKPTDVVIQAASPAAPALSYIAPAAPATPLSAFTLVNLSVASFGDTDANPALTFDGSAQNTAAGQPVFGNGLTLEDVVLRSGTVTIAACASILLSEMTLGSDDALRNGPLNLLGNAKAIVRDSTTANVVVNYSSPSLSVAQQEGVFFQRCMMLASTDANLAIFGSAVVGVDADCVVPVRGTNFTGTSVLGFVSSQTLSIGGVPIPCDPYISFHGTVGAQSIGAPSGEQNATSSFFINFGAAPPFANGPTAAKAWGFNGDGGTFYCGIILFAPDFSFPFDPLVHRFTANDAFITGGILLTGPVAVTNRAVFSAHGSTILPMRRPNTVQIRTNIDCDLRLSTFSPDEVTVSAGGALDRSSVLLAKLPGALASQPFTFNGTVGISVPFPTYVDGANGFKDVLVTPGAATAPGDLPLTQLMQTYGPVAFTYGPGAPGAPTRTYDFLVSRP